MKIKINAKNIGQFVWKYYRRRMWAVVLVIFFFILLSILEIWMPYVMGQVTDVIANTSIEDPVFAFWEAFKLLMVVAGIGVFFHILSKVNNMIYDRYIKCPAMRDSVIDVFANVQKFSNDWHNNSFAGAIVTKLKRGMWAVETLGDNFLHQFIRIGILMLGMLVFLIIKWPFMGALFALGATFYTLMSIWMSKKFIAPRAQKWVKSDSKLGGQIADSMTGNATVKSFAKESHEDKLFTKITDKWIGRLFTLYIRLNIVNMTQNLLMTGVKMSLFAMGIFLWATGQASVGDFVFVTGVYALLSGYLRQIGDKVRDTQRAANDIEEMVEYSLTPLQVQDHAQAKKFKPGKGDIEFKNVHFNYPEQNDMVYKNLSLKIKAGEKIALVGHSGGGKSTLVKLIQRLYDIQSGQILIDGQDISQVTKESLRQSIALVPQDPILFHRSLKENIRYGTKRATQKQIVEASKKAHAHEFIKNLPQKYDTLVGERGVKLSGGQRQRIAIARAMLSPASILILDEATSSLDSISESYIQDAIAKLQEGKTTIIIAHRLSTIKNADRILLIEEGKIVEEGKHTQLLKKKGRYAKLWNHQVGGFI